MKTTRILTLEEATTQLKFHFGTVEGEELDIIIEVSTPPEQRSIPITEALNVVRKFYKRHGEDKIPAIKALREHFYNKGFYIGLAEAKSFVESL
jgi:ribosomal protein L7/L12